MSNRWRVTCRRQHHHMTARGQWSNRPTAKEHRDHTWLTGGGWIAPHVLTTEWYVTKRSIVRTRDWRGPPTWASSSINIMTYLYLKTHVPLLLPMISGITVLRVTYKKGPQISSHKHCTSVLVDKSDWTKPKNWLNRWRRICREYPRPSFTDSKLYE